MAAELLTLDELIARATDISNYKSNDAEALAVANQVNREIGGPSSVVKLIIQRLQMRQEVVTLQALNVVECCVKNCGVKFHNEIGKYKFINELIKLLSPKYDGAITPQGVKDRIIGLLFAWYVGLPLEKKIGEAYQMLKQQGIIKRDPVDPEAQNVPMPSREPQNTAFEDEGKSELLKTLLTSNNPDDLQSANKLIKTMVKEEEQRLERVSKRIQELETVSNNVRVLDEMLATYTPDSPTTSMEVMNDLYESCLKMRPELFRLASRSAEDQDDSMAEILCASDELTRVIDLYKEIVLMKKVSHQKPFHISEGQSDINSSSLLDLDFNAPVQSTMESKEVTSHGNSLLDEQFKLLGLDIVENVPTQPPQQLFDQFQSFTQPQMPQQPVQQQMPPIQQRVPMQMGHETNISQFTSFPLQPSLQSTVSYGAPTNSQPIGSMRPVLSATGAASVLPSATGASVLPRMTTNKSSGKAAIPQRKDVLDFDVFSDFRHPENQKGQISTDVTTNDHEIKDNTDGASQSIIDHLIDISTDEPSLVPISAQPNNTTFSETPINTTQPAHSLFQSVDSLRTTQTQENYLVPLEALKIGTYDPIVVHDKYSIKTFLNIATDTREGANPNVIATILSTISTNTVSIQEFTIQVAVPKAMRVKLQPATSNTLTAFNPILPPSSVTQIMLIANPTKENVRLRFKITYSINGVVYAENASIDQLPVT